MGCCTVGIDQKTRPPFSSVHALFLQPTFQRVLKKVLNTISIMIRTVSVYLFVEQVLCIGICLCIVPLNLRISHLRQYLRQRRQNKSISGGVQTLLIEKISSCTNSHYHVQNVFTFLHLLQRRILITSGYWIHIVRRLVLTYDGQGVFWSKQHLGGIFLYSCSLWYI